ncbi:DUF6507 family protein [Mycobacterium hubeiense]|uniref:DUF6507 family protein n=1 Tax=Mycobacterium hubeiense TaxID=1867256 RepID=UPI000C7F6367|nr:DUF6507 family protein [Mycobacterium sp. QGD 101]
MTSPGEPLKVDPSKLQLTADQLDSHAGGFQSALEAACSRAGKASLGSGLAAAALPGMLAAWEADGARFATQFANHAQGHREAARAYVSTDSDSAGEIDEAGAGLS